MGVRGTGRRKDHTPVMRQFLRAKGQYPDAIVLFRLGDFYETFYEDAHRAAEILDIALTSRGTDPNGNRIPMAGVPHHAAAGYIASLLRQGEKVAICEQMADPATVRGVVPREVVRVVTPGLCLEPDALDARAENHLVAVTPDRGLAAFELSTGTLRACVADSQAVLAGELVRLDPREVLVEGEDGALLDLCAQALPRALVRATDPLDLASSESILQERAPGLYARAVQGERAEAAARAASIALAYAARNQPGSAVHVHQASLYTPGEQLVLDEAAVRNLELVRTTDGERKGSLLHLLDETQTPMGARTLRRQLLAPLTDVERIRRRQDAVELFAYDPGHRAELRGILSRIADLERLAVRAAVGLATPRDLGAIRDGLNAAEEVDRSLRGRPEAALDDILRDLLVEDRCADVRETLESALVADPPTVDRLGGIFRDGHLEELDSFRALSASSKDVILDLERRERLRTGIASLKIKFTKVFGYYIEITKSNLDAVPDDYVRKQTIANGERYITAELAELQDRILHADERARSLELAEFVELRRSVGGHAPRLHRLARGIARIDTSTALAEVAHRHDYVRPQVDGSKALYLEDSRHPTVERYAASDGFVPNTIDLDAERTRLMLLTGPNMAGKSTAMRQAALCVIMAQAGGFVPARTARIGVVDRIYTRVGASDQLARGQSTFMVEMTEAASILRGASSRSFVVLDEIGRGTSTHDGLAIAWAVAEHLHDAIGCRAIFATHYHELCTLADALSGAANFNVVAKEHGDAMVFLHRLLPGGSSRSYGLAVARLAGVPPIVLARAKTKLSELEAQEPNATPLFEPAPNAPALEATLRALDLERMTPIDALVTLQRLRNMCDDPDRHS